MSLCSRDDITIRQLNDNGLTGLTCSKVPGFWVVEHQLVMFFNICVPVTIAKLVLLILGLAIAT